MLAVASAGLLVIASFSAFSYTFSDEKDKPQAIPESEALGLPVDISLVFTETEANYDTSDGSYVVVHEGIIDSRRHCEFCTVIEFRDGPSSDTPDVSWIADRNFDIVGAKKVTFYAMGERGGESVIFNAAGKKVDRVLGGTLVEALDFAVETKPVTLTNEWQKYELDLSTTNLAGVSSPFGIEAERGENTGITRIFIKGMMLESEPATDPLPLEMPAAG